MSPITVDSNTKNLFSAFLTLTSFIFVNFLFVSMRRLSESTRFINGILNRIESAVSDVMWCIIIGYYCIITDTYIVIRTVDYSQVKSSSL